MNEIQRKQKVLETLLGMQKENPNLLSPVQAPIVEMLSQSKEASESIRNAIIQRRRAVEEVANQLRSLEGQLQGELGRGEAYFNVLWEMVKDQPGFLIQDAERKGPEDAEETA